MADETTLVHPLLPGYQFRVTINGVATVTNPEPPKESDDGTRR